MEYMAMITKLRLPWTACICGVLTAGITAALPGCAVGPDYEAPAPPKVKGYTAGDLPAVMTPGAGEPEQRFAAGKTLAGDWWLLYRSPRLNQVIDRAISGNPTLAAAQATLAQAQQAVIQAQGGFYPQLDVAASTQRQRTPGARIVGAGASAATIAAINNLYSLGPTVSYAPDVFGGTRRHVEQEKALAENQRYELAAAYLTLSGNVLTQALNIASTRVQIRAVQDILADDERNLQLVKVMFDAGKSSRLEMLTAESQLANDRTQLPPLQQQLSVARHALTILTGSLPGQWSAPDFDLSEFTLPAQLPVSIPSELVHQRPDILAGEAQLHASSAAIGVAASQLYPSITLSASFGAESLAAASLFQGTSEFWSLAANLTAPIIHGGELQAQKQAAIEAFRASAATYQQTVLTAFGQVADSLRALSNDADMVSAQKRAFDVSTTSLELQRQSYAVGKSNLLQLIDAERSHQQARLGYARAQGQRYQDTAQFLLAIGGGVVSARD
jgi:NodT family efflux transporter outer membrane factor (OMF) lipoprotein